MSFDVNSVTIVGRLTRDTELSYTPSNNTPLCKFSIATNSGKEDKDVSFFNITCWKKVAENCNQYLSKGKQVVISGRLQQSRFQDKSGQNRSSVEIIASSVQFIGAKTDEGNSMTSPEKSSYEKANEKEQNDFENIDFDNPNNDAIPF